MSVTPESIEDLSPQERRELLARLLREKTDGRKRCPLSFAQARLWVLDRFLPGNPTYNVPLPLRLPGRLDVRALERSLNEIVRRHETLRTTFEVEDGKPVQVVAPSLDLKLEVIDLRRLPAAEREEAANRKVFEESAYSFDLAKGPLVRTTLIKLADTDHIFLVVMHHIISDGWSMRVFYQELSTLYLVYCQGRPSPLAELPVQYTDFTQWQAKRLSVEVLEQELSYWRSQLAGLPPSLELPTDRPRPPIQSHRGALHAFSVDRQLLDGLQALGRAEGATTFMVLLAAFQLLLSRYSGTQDFAVGTPIAGRTRVELEGLIGFFVNTLVLRADLSGDPSFRELLRRVREVTLGAYAH
ncbi:MAG TPA: condensation domain-containing protein, partial [Pyrinomonadaceae bacterium]|nr:condensation domain-containing protein [Pyrinomonadaceae bacterium]